MSDLMITGVIDGDLSGGLPKAIQVTALADIADLSVYGLGVANNGDGTDGREFTFPASAVSAGTTLYVASEAPGFTNFFGFAPDFVAGNLEVNGDDAVELFLNEAVVDLFGDIDIIGDNQVWDYTDGWASRDPSEGPSPTFDPAEWTFSGRGGLNDETTNATAANPFPVSGDAGGAPDVAINEFRISSSDNGETSNFVELFTDPSASLDGKTLVVLSGEFDPGQIDFAIDLSDAVTDAEGFVLIANDQNPNLEPSDAGVSGLDFFGSPQSFLIVEGFTGAAGEDLDPDDDGVLDTIPWTEVLDSVAVVDGDGNPDFSFSDTVIPADGPFPAAAAARVTDGTGDFASLPFNDTVGETPGSTNTPDTAAERVTIMEIQGAGHVSGLVSADPLDPTTGGSGPRVTTS
ncbi:MAG: hypothetical protein AAGF22_08470, partial [Pseudomonadota bacterium]